MDAIESTQPRERGTIPNPHVPRGLAGGSGCGEAPGCS